MGELIELVALTVTVGLAILANNRWLVGRMDQQRVNQGKSIENVHRRIDVLERESVSKIELLGHLTKIETSVARINGRLDQLFLHLHTQTREATPMTFAEALRIVLALEGGLVDDPRDPGGVTRHGISLRFLRGVLPGADADTVRSLTLEQARGLYRRHFWQACRCGDMPPGLDLCLFDGAVNQGRGAAARLLQRAVGAVADGAIGPATLTAVRAADPMTLIQDFMARRAKRYAAAPAVATFGRGWFRRLFAIHRRALEEARA